MAVDRTNIFIDTTEDEYWFRVPEDLDEAYELYSRYPIIQSILRRDLKVRLENIHGVESEPSYYTVKGFLYEIRGQEFEGSLTEEIYDV